jgi:hypothetical protein
LIRTNTNKIDAGIIARFCLTIKPEIGFQVYPNRGQGVNKYWKDGCLQILALSIEGVLVGMEVIKLIIIAGSRRLASTPTSLQYRIVLDLNDY